MLKTLSTAKFIENKRVECYYFISLKLRGGYINYAYYY